MRIRPLIALFALSLATSAFAQKADDADARAMKKLAAANAAEVEAGKLAAEKAKSAEVKQFGQHMVDDHGKMLEDLKKMAAAKGVELPASADLEDKAKILKLRALSGDNFDRDYMAEMVKDHQQDVQETQELAESVKDPQLKSAIRQANAKIKEHLAMAQRVASSAGAASGGTSGSSSK